MHTRRTFLLTLPAAALAMHPAFSLAVPDPAAPNTVPDSAAPNAALNPTAPDSARSRIFIGTTGSTSRGIYTAAWNAATGELGEITVAAEVASPSFLALQGKHLYACSEIDGEAAKATAYAVTPSGLTKINEQSSLGSGTTFISAKNNSVFVANYGGGSVTSFHITPDGALSKPVSHFQYEGSGPNKERQDHSHAHSALSSPDGRFLLVSDLGLDRIVIYRVNPATAELIPNEPPYFTTRPGVGPRHLAWHPNQRFLYSVNELDSTVDLLDWDSVAGKLTQRAFFSTLDPAFPKDTAFAGEIGISRDGHFLYVGNRVGSDTIAAFSIDSKSGALKLEQLAPNGGKNTRFLTIDPSGRWMLLCNQASNAIVILARDPSTGKLSESRHTYRLDKPQCIVFA
jgi:6-phosphogluconolactonase